MSTRGRRILLFGGSLVVAMIGTLAWRAVAQGHGEAEAVLRLVPYQGDLEQNGAKVDGPVDIAFALYPVRSGGTAHWREPHVQVPIANGRFTVLLGSQLPIPLEVMNSPELYLEVEVAGDVLQGRQRFFASPAAVAASHGVPPGAIVAFAGAAAPSGWLLCDGSEVRRENFKTLFDAIGVAHGSGDGSSTFMLPDYRGRFLRGVDRGAQRDPDSTTRVADRFGGNQGDTVGSVQLYATGLPENPLLASSSGSEHSHSYADNSGWSCAGTPANADSTCGESGNREDATRVTIVSGAHSHSVTGGDAETRPENVNVNWIIKY